MRESKRYAEMTALACMSALDPWYDRGPFYAPKPATPQTPEERQAKLDAAEARRAKRAAKLRALVAKGVMKGEL